MSVNTMLADHLSDIIRRYDTTRPITSGCNEPSPNNALRSLSQLDRPVVGVLPREENLLR